jgi:hypothetical protein
MAAALELPRGFRFPAAPAPARAVPPAPGVISLAGRRASRRDDGATRPIARPAGSGWMRAAAAVALVALPLVAVQPLRAGVGAWLAERWAEVTGQEAPARSVAPEAMSAAAAAATLRFTPPPGDLRVDIAAPQESGTLTLRLVEGAEAALEIRGGTTEVPLLSERGVAIQNAPGSTASYELMLPAGTSRVVVRVGEGEARAFAPPTSAAPVVVPLGPRAR